MSACEQVIALAEEIDLVQGPEVVPIWREYVNAFLECNGHLENDTQDSSDIHDLATRIVGRLKNPYITVDDTDLQIGSIIAGSESTCSDPSQTPQSDADPVMSFNGQFVHETQDVSLAGAGINFVFTRCYKNQVQFPGPLGCNWNHSYNQSLRVAQQTIFRTAPDLRVEPYQRHPNFGQNGFNYWVPPDGQDGVIVEHGSSFVWRAPHGVRHFYQQSPNPQLHRLDRIEDRNGNYLQFSYAEDSLSQVAVNHPERLVTFSYDDQGRIATMRDFTGREWSYCYDDFGDLVSVTSPATLEYPGGLTTCYEYSSAEFSGDLQHNLQRIIDPAGRTYVENEYGADSGLSFNRVVRQRQGGGEYSFDYADLPPDGDFDYADEERPAHETSRIERNGQPVCQVFNRFGQLLSETQRILDHGVLRTLTWRYRFNRDGALVGSLSPDGVMTQNLYGREYFARRFGLDPSGQVLPDALTLEERQGFGRMLATVKRARRYDLSELNLARGVWGDFFPDVIGGLDPADIIGKFTFEPTYGQLLTASDCRFTRSADPAAQTAALGEDPRYEATLTRCVYAGPAANPGSDPTRLLSEIRLPTPTLPDGSAGGLVVDRFTDYDERGRLLRAVDALGTVTENGYFGAADGLREGFLKRTVADPAGLAVTTEYEVDLLGRVVAVHRPRAVGAPPGRFITRTTFNELDQVVMTVQSEPFAFASRRFYDPSGKLCREERDARDETGADLPDGPEIRAFCYDNELNLVEESTGGRDALNRLVKRHQYDRAGRKLRTVLPEGNRIRYRYDERMLMVSQTIGEGTDLAATTRSEYDGDGRIRTLIDARGNATTFTCDPFGRVVSVEDRLGTIIRREFDKHDQITVKRVFEKRHDGYYLVVRNEVSYDELGRQVRNAVNRFDDPQGPVPANELATAFLAGPVAGDQLISTTFFDERNHPIRGIDALQREMRYQYDALGRVALAIDPMGNQAVSRYDAHGNLVRRDRIDVVRDPDDPAIVTGQRVFSTSYAYDELDRMVACTDSLGNVAASGYDSRGLVVRQTDPLGNTVTIAYDINRRRVRQRSELTATGLGGSAVEQVVEERYEFDRNSNLVGATDSLGRRMSYEYDALDRRRVIVFPDASRRTAQFDADGHLIHTRDNNGLQHRFTLDALGRTTGVDVDISEVTGGETGGAMFQRYAYDALNRRIREANDFAASEFRYNSMGWPLSESTICTVPGAALSGPFQIDREFNEGGALVGIRYPNGRTLSVERDDLGRVRQLQNVLNGADYPGDPASPDAYEIARFDFAGRQRSRRRNGNGTIAAYAQDGLGRVIEVDHSGPGGALLTLQYLFDGAGNVRTRNEIAGVATIGEAFSYDSMRRLANVSLLNLPVFDPVPLGPATAVPPDPLPRRQDDIDAVVGPLVLPPAPRTFEYDLAGNRQVEQAATTVAYTTNDLDQYTRVEDAGAGTVQTLQYNLNGAVVDDGVRTYVYDSVNRLVKVAVAGAPVAEFFHDARGRRIMERTATATLQLVWDDLRAISEYRSGRLFAQYVYGSGSDRLVQVAARPGAPGAPGAEHWYHADVAGSVRLLTTRAGTVAAGYGYAPFGQSRDTPAGEPYNPFLYTGLRFDKELGTYDAHLRQYDPALGRFLQRDPAGSSDGSNLYAYAANAPLGNIDPLGTEATCVMDRTAVIENYFQPYWYRLGQSEAKQIDRMTAAAPEESKADNRAKVEKVFGAYRAILHEMQDAALAGRDIDIKELWNQEHDYKGWDFEDKAWMGNCNKCYENPSLADVGPFGGDKVMGVDIPLVFRIVTGDEQPNPSLGVRIFRFVSEAVILFGPDLAMGLEFGLTKKAALEQGAVRAARLDQTGLTAAEFRHTIPGDPIAMGTYAGGYERFMEREASELGYRTLGTSPVDAKQLGIEPPVPNSVHDMGNEAIVDHEVNQYLKPADRIAFWLTGKEHEFPNSITTMELRRIMDDPELFNKTRFLINPFAVEEVAEWAPAAGVRTIGHP